MYHYHMLFQPIVERLVIGNQSRFDDMKAFFGSVGHGDEAGVWEEVPVMHPDFKKEVRRQFEKKQKKRKAEEMG